MEPLEIKDVISVMDGEVSGRLSGVIHGVSIDTRSIHPGEAFFAVKGERTDGQKFSRDAEHKGAALLVLHDDPQYPATVPYLVVKNTVLALGELASFYRQRFDLTVVGVTGSVGKTTTRRMIASSLGKSMLVVESIKNYNNLLGVPLSVFQIERMHDVAVLEAGISVPGEMERLAKMILPDVVALTNVAPVHLEGLGSVENVAREKFALVKYSNPGSYVIVNADDPLLVRFNPMAASQTVTYGIESSADYRAEDIVLDAEGKASFSVDGQRIALGIPGRFNIYNALCAYAVARLFRVPGEKIVEALEGFRTLAGRMKLLRIGGITVLDDTYNANPLSVREALETLARMKVEGRRIAVIGDMLETGKDEANYHEKIADYSCAVGVDFLATVGERTQKTHEKASSIGFPCAHFETKKELILFLEGFVMPKDIVLVKGSRAMRMEEIVESIVELWQKRLD
ncbi:MAG: hypothetical protein B6D65_02700 [candidate division Zixibacteria bacterium 4484_93]|nr:MAG: hypothetical protein B6D65_02700 [candidate division Zixibacteria bacterium 4484_93]